MVKLKRVVEFNLNPYFESKQDEERLRAYLGDDLFNQYMDVRKKLPNLSNQFKDFTNVSFDTGSKDNDIKTKKDLVNSYNRLIKYLPKDKQSLFKQRNINNYSRLGGKTLETLLDKYKEARDIVFKDQARFRDFGQLSKIPVSDIQDWVDSFSTNRAKKQQDKIEGADKLYEDSDWSVYRITTYPAAQLYGSNTKWCITGRYPRHEGRGEEYFNDYIRDNNLDGGYYFYISKRDPSEKYCVLQRKDNTIHSIWDSSDTLRGSSYDELGVSLPEVKGIHLPKFSPSSLIKAITEGDLEKVKEHINNGVDINLAYDSEGKTALWNALSNKSNSDIVTILLDNNADPNLCNRDYDSECPLHYSVRDSENNLSFTRLLLNKGADPNKEDAYGRTALINAIETKNLPAVRLLLDNSADPNGTDEEGKSALELAFIICDKFNGNNSDCNNIFSTLLEHGADPNVSDNTGETILEKALNEGYYNIIETLLKHGADVNIQTYSSTALSDAVYNNDVDLISLLLKYGADTNYRDLYGNAPIHNVSSNKIIQTLLDNGANINILNNNGDTPLISNYKNRNDLDIINYLLKKGADPLIKNYDNLNLRDISILEHDTKLQAVLDKYTQTH